MLVLGRFEENTALADCAVVPVYLLLASFFSSESRIPIAPSSLLSYRVIVVTRVDFRPFEFLSGMATPVEMASI